MPTPWSLRFWCKNWDARDILWKFGLLLQFTIVLLYSASRLFIIVEALISLRRLPVGYSKWLHGRITLSTSRIANPQITFDLRRDERLIWVY